MKLDVSQIATQRCKPSLATIAALSVVAVSFATPAVIATQAQMPQPQPLQQPTNRRTTPVQLPNSVSIAVRRTHAREFKLPIATLQIASFSRETWSDGCLGLGKPNESCLAALVDGWYVEVSDGTQSWFYRTDATGRSIRLEDPNLIGSLPLEVSRKVLRTVAQAQNVPVNQLQIAAARSMTWDGCLGVAGPTDACTMIAIPGWQVIVSGPQQYWVYHINQTADQIKLNPTNSSKSTVLPTFWQPDPRWFEHETGDEVVFQSVTSGGVAGLVYQTTLLKNGQVLRTNLGGNAATTPKVIRQLSPQQVEAFTQTLQQQEFGDFLGFSYLPTTGADYYTIALILPGSKQGMQYADGTEAQTPIKLQRVIQAWNRIASPVQSLN